MKEGGGKGGIGAWDIRLVVNRFSRLDSHMIPPEHSPAAPRITRNDTLGRAQSLRTVGMTGLV